MAFQHTLYLKRDAEKVAGLPDEQDGVLYHWCSGTRDFSSSVRAHGTLVDSERGIYHFTLVQAVRFYADITKEIYEQYRVLMDGYEDFQDELYKDEDKNLNADLLALNSYAILRFVSKDMKDAPMWYTRQFEESYKMDKIMKGFAHLLSRMEADDILVWEAA